MGGGGGASPAVYRAKSDWGSFPPERARLYLVHLPVELIGVWGIVWGGGVCPSLSPPGPASPN